MQSYVPLRDYALIGDCHGAALVSREGSVDWCTLGRFDADPVFCRILDAAKGGFLEAMPANAFETERRYLERTNILQTTFTTDTGRIALTDFMPLGRKPGAGVHDYVSLNAPFRLVRLVEGLEGTVRLRIGYRPSPEFARRAARLTRTGHGIACPDGPYLHTDLNDHLSVADDLAAGEVHLSAGTRYYLMVSPDPMPAAVSLQDLDRLLAITRAFWEEWSAYCRYDGPYREPVVRSALVLKMLTYAPTGAIVAAPTTSLPEQFGGERNWDYRYCWLRDAAFTLHALARLGYSGEARRFSDFLKRSCRASAPELRIGYGICSETELEEHCLDHLEGYRHSRPVRVGNAAFTQQQLDVHGEVMDWALIYRTLGGKVGPPERRLLRSMVDYVTARWDDPDQGIWEMRGPPRHHVYGKIMAWVAVDRALRLFGPCREWSRLRDRIYDTVLEHGVDGRSDHLKLAFDDAGVDAALLMIPKLDFPLPDRILEATVDAVERQLKQGDYVYRYRTEDGLPGNEGAFLMCSFWLVDALLFLGREAQARALYERLLRCGNDLGLYSEEIEPDTGEFLGNFPQAFTHLALIESASHLDLCARGGPAALRGTQADRARLDVEATAGLKAIWAAFKKTRRVGRLRSSRASILPATHAKCGDKPQIESDPKP
ncbi:MAG: glycoside hydrolase family 15 protein [Methylohalobius sp. ZOD2]